MKQATRGFGDASRRLARGYSPAAERHHPFPKSTAEGAVVARAAAWRTCDARTSAATALWPSTAGSTRKKMVGGPQAPASVGA